MTIAACYVSAEGVVLGADSTSTYAIGDVPHYYNNAQKLFEIGENATLGAVMWGLGGLVVYSHRTLLATLADDIAASPPSNLAEVALRWAKLFGDAYADPTSALAPEIAKCKLLAAKQMHAPGQPPNPSMRTQDEEEYLQRQMNALTSGSCIAGYLPGDRQPAAFEIIFTPLNTHPTPVECGQGWRFWGAPNMIQRLIFGCDQGLKQAILGSGKWTGTSAELDQLVGNHTLEHPVVPVRDAIDFVHSCIYSTIKAFKFSALSQICGGPIEIAVITTDRHFRWVRHKELDAAITEGEKP